MIDHDTYRRAIMADPRDPDPGLREHRDGCPECRAFGESLQQFESRLGRALRVEVPTRAEVLPFARKATTPRARPWGRLALAASLGLGFVLAGVVWLALPERSLAADVVAHVTQEPLSWQGTGAVANSNLSAVLRDEKLLLRPDAGVVSYASSCLFRGHIVPHLVVQTDSGPVTVMVLVHESALRPMQFDEQGYRGTIVPVPHHGSIAILMRSAGADAQTLRRIAARVSASIDWTG